VSLAEAGERLGRPDVSLLTNCRASERGRNETSRLNLSAFSPAKENSDISASPFEVNKHGVIMHAVPRVMG